MDQQSASYICGNRSVRLDWGIGQPFRDVSSNNRTQFMVTRHDHLFLISSFIILLQSGSLTDRFNCQIVWLTKFVVWEPVRTSETCCRCWRIFWWFQSTLHLLVKRGDGKWHFWVTGLRGLPIKPCYIFFHIRQVHFYSCSYCWPMLNTYASLTLFLWKHMLNIHS